MHGSNETETNESPAGGPVAVVILAAGASTRMGMPKQLLEWKGKTLLQHVVDAAAASCAEEIVVVLGLAAGEVQTSLKLSDRARVAVNPDFARGQARSLQVGLRACSPRCGAAVVVLADEPQVRPQYIDLVAKTWREGNAPIVRCTFDGIPGHPVLLARRLWPELSTEGDEGARSLIGARPDLVHDVELAERRPVDVDTPADLSRLK